MCKEVGSGEGSSPPQSSEVIFSGFSGFCVLVHPALFGLCALLACCSNLFLLPRPKVAPEGGVKTITERINQLLKEEQLLNGEKRIKLVKKVSPKKVNMD